jgi:hypothetical protein
MLISEHDEDNTVFMILVATYFSARAVVTVTDTTFYLRF